MVKMLITVKLVGAFRGISGKTKVSIRFENKVSLKEAIKTIVQELPKLKRTLIDPDLGDPRQSTLILVNGKEISVLNGLETMLKDGDELILVPVVHGG